MKVCGLVFRFLVFCFFNIKLFSGVWGFAMENSFWFLVWNVWVCDCLSVVCVCMWVCIVFVLLFGFWFLVFGWWARRDSNPGPTGFSVVFMSFDFFCGVLSLYQVSRKFFVFL